MECFLEEKYKTEEEKLTAVKRCGYNIQYIKTPSKAVQLAAVKQDGSAIAFINNPSEEVQLEAVKKNWYAIKYIKNPSEEVIHEAILHTDNIVELKHTLAAKNIDWDKISDETKLLLEIKEF